MLSVSDEVLVFRMSRRASDSAEWLPASRLLVHVGDGESAVPAHLSWVTEDGAQSAVGFSPDCPRMRQRLRKRGRPRQRLDFRRTH